ncbi:HAD family hydrolase [Peptoanaerobacter stomatis]|uniref:HAD family hydrolase n=1 Tax=Peptoanaerobacter stomatis TaxID=796937 RepID=UPI003FA02B36
MQTEELYIIEQFKTHFEKFKNKNIVLYGIGKNTKLILEKFSDYNIIALMDSNEEGNVIYGKRVISKKQAIELNPIIIIIARFSVVDIIYRRISDLSDEHNISIYDISGKLIKNNLDFKMIDDEYFSMNFSDLKRRAFASDIISFDIFDTLIARKIYEPNNIFKVVENILLSKKIYIDFYKNRIDSFKECGKYADIDDIYKKFNEKIDSSYSHEIENIKKLELDIERNFFYKRSKIVCLLKSLKKAGKKIFLISDMYYTENILKDVLSHLGINEYDYIFVSCEEKAEKEEGSLYKKYLNYLKENNLNGKLLHIGDNIVADIRFAQKHDIPTFYYLNSNELILKSSIRSLLSKSYTIFSEISIGLIKKRLFDDPFSLSDTKGIPQIRELKDIGYLVFGSIITNFMIFFIKNIISKGIDLVLFPSRDGYLISKIYEKIRDKFSFLPKCVYFRASRRSCQFMNIQTIDDIKEILNSDVSGDLHKSLEYKLNIKIPEDLKSREDINKFVLDRVNIIINNSAEQRNYYIDYMKDLGILDRELNNIAIFDFVAKGSVQYYLSKILNINFCGYYFATMNLNEKWDKYEFAKSNINTLHGNITSYENTSEFSKNYLLMETILQDDKGTFFEIDKSKNIIFSSSRNSLEIECISKIQDGIIEFVEDFIELVNILNIGCDNDFCDDVLKYMKYCVKNDDLKVLTADDEYNGIDEYGIWSK